MALSALQILVMVAGVQTLLFMETLKLEEVAVQV
jgi:hypothetical protein